MKKKFGITVLVLSLLAALEPLSIDLYLPAFSDIANSFGVNIGQVQISLSVFLAGFALGQLFWGPLSDFYGRKVPIIIAILLFTLSSFAANYVASIYQLWIIRFIQAFGGCAGVVIGRAMVNEIFEEKHRTKIFSLLVVISGVAPIIAPTVGNLLLKNWHWNGIFNTMGLLGLLTILSVLFLLPESGLKRSERKNLPSSSIKNIVRGYIRVVDNRQFIKYSLIGCMAYGGLMIYVSNAPFLIMEKGMFSGDMFSLIFAVNAVGLMAGTIIVNYLSKRITLERIIEYSVYAQVAINIILLNCTLYAVSIPLLLVLVFLNLVVIGILMPSTTSLGLAPFDEDSGTASAFMGFLQLLFTFVFSGLVSYLQDDSILPMMVALFLCAFGSFLTLFMKSRSRRNSGFRVQESKVVS